MQVHTNHTSECKYTHTNKERNKQTDKQTLCPKGHIMFVIGNGKKNLFPMLSLNLPPACPL